MTPQPRRALAGLIAAAAVAAGLVAAPGGADAAPVARVAHAAVAASAWTARPAAYDETVTTKDLPIRMSDGTTLYGDLIRPAVDGEPIDAKVPVIVTITAYNKTVTASPGAGALAGAGPTYLVERGYAQLTVDARGTGSSEGVWKAFSAREGKDAGEVVTWAHRQPWSNGDVGMTGPSYMGISQLLAAGQHPPGLKAIFPQVPAADVYRDVVASGGQIDVGFIPLWLGLVTGTGLIPPAYAAGTPNAGLRWLTDRLSTAGTFTAPLMLDAILGGDSAYDGAFYQERSPINHLDGVTVPTFLIGGEFDLFQRGTPLVFERLQRNGAPVKMIVGPWDHLQGSQGKDVADAGYGTLAELQLRWFDQWIKGRDGHLDEIAPVSYYEQGTGRWVRTQRWVDRDLEARSYRLSGDSVMGGRTGALRTGKPAAGTSTLLPLPVSGLCTRSANQWTAGVVGMLWPKNPCFLNNRLNDKSGLVFQTAPVRRKVRIQGPINARLYVSAPSGDGMLSVSVEDVAPDGTVTRLTGGWQVISQRALDRNRSRYLDGALIQPHHPFTKASQRRLAKGEVAPVDVEVFPTGAAIRPGHRLRLAVQGYDIPHLLAPLTGTLRQGLPIRVHTGPAYPSAVTLPVR